MYRRKNGTAVNLEDAGFLAPITPHVRSPLLLQEYALLSNHLLLERDITPNVESHVFQAYH